MARKFLILLLIIFPVVGFAMTQQLVPLTKETIVSAFKYYKNVSPNITKTSVIEVPFNQSSFSIPTFAVYNLTTSSFEPNLLSVNVSETRADISATGAINSSSSMNDGNYSTYTEFPLTADSNKTEILFNFDKPITASSLSFTLDNYVALPQAISISIPTNSGRGDHVVLAPIHPTNGSVVFPQTTSAIWSVVFDYVQPLRISEIKFNDISSKVMTRGLRFLAHSGQNYQIYFDADRYVQSTNVEAGDLFSSEGIVYGNASSSIPNSSYRPADSDSDSVPDLVDNCVNIANADQKDEDRNGRGDACEDDDRDSVLNIYDNCPQIPNGAQIDTDKDDIGDICDDFENRVTERLSWLPWVGIGFAGLVIFGLFALVLLKKKNDNTPSAPNV